MGTKVHSNMQQLPGYYSMRNLNGNTGSVGWLLQYENRNSGPYDDLFLTRLAMGYDDKEQMRQTILKHDTIFRHQLHELHRLYRVQRDMMNEIKSEEGNKHLVHAVTLQSNPISPGFISEDELKRWHSSESHLLDLNGFRLSRSGAHSTQSQFSPLKRSVVQSAGCCLTQNDLKFKNCEILESQCKVQSRLFDLERPIEGDRGVSAVSGLESYHLKRSYEVPHRSGGNFSVHYNGNCNSNGEATSFNLNLKRTRGFTDLNEPILVEEASTSACVGIPEFCQESHKARERGSSLNNLHLDAERRPNGWFSNKFENGQTRSNGSFHPQDLLTVCKPIQVETTNAHSAGFLLSNQINGETIRKRKIFGVEIPEKSNGTSAVASHALDPPPVCSLSDSANPEMLSCSTQTKFSGILNQNLLGNLGSRTYGQLSTSSTASMLGHDIVSSKLLVDSNSRSLPSLRAEVPPQNDFHFGRPFDSKESHGCYPSVGFCNQNGIIESKIASEQSAQHSPKGSFKLLPWMMEAKFSVDLNMGAAAVDGYENKEIAQSSSVSVNGSIKQNSNGGFSWLRATRPYNLKPVKEVEGSHQMDLDSSQNCSQQLIDETAKIIQDSLSATCVDDVKRRKSDTSCSSSITKLLGFPISENVCRDMPSPNSPLQPGPPASTIDGVNFVMTHGPPPPQCGQLCLVEGPVSEKRLVNQNVDIRQIDLNLCVIEEGIEEDGQSTSFSMRNNAGIPKIDLETPVTIEKRTKVASGCEPLESHLTEPSNMLPEEISESQESLSVSVAAEALIAISASCVVNLQQKAGSHDSEISTSDSLHWFAEIVASCWNDIENDVGSANGACLDNSITDGDGIDVFEFMTLNLTETKVEEFSYNPQVQENKKSEDTLRRRPPRRGQARRGRQRKDFQRDVLPNLTSLSRNEVTEDFLMIEGLIRAIGGNWQSRLTQKNNAKGSTARGRKRAVGSAPPTPTEDCSNQFQQMKTGFEERSLAGWGKRTRRPPRQRCLISSPPLAIK
ncbi:hypothetical protein PTKIN_Ptkin08bG0061600 [Pterospermum kingtungense]